MTDRDTFAAAALPFVAKRGLTDEQVAAHCYRWADTMLAERSRTGQKLSESASFCAVCPERESTNHDAAPAARASAESVAPQPTASDRSGNSCVSGRSMTSHSGTGNQPSPPCVEKDGLTGPINRTPERQSPDRECGESQLRDVPRPDTKGKAAGGPEPSFSDRPKPVKDDDSDRSKPISDNRLAALEELSAMDQELELEYGLTGNPMIKARRCKAAKTDTTPQRNGALSDGPDPDSRVWETPCTPPQGSFRDSKNAKEPVAWAVETGGELEASFCGPAGREDTADWREQSDGVIVPLYRSPTLTDEEREAVEVCAHAAKNCNGFGGDPTRPAIYEGRQVAATLRGLLERLA